MIVTLALKNLELKLKVKTAFCLEKIVCKIESYIKAKQLEKMENEAHMSEVGIRLELLLSSAVTGAVESAEHMK